MKTRTWLGMGAGMAVLVGAFLWAFREQPVAVEVAPVVRGLFEQSVDEDGKTRVRERYVVSAPLAGQLERIRFKSGDPVTRGMPLALLYPSAPALLDTRTVRELEERLGAADAALAQARAEVARSDAALAQARNDLKRTMDLASGGFVSPSAREQSELTMRVQSKAAEAARFAQDGAHHNVEQARAALQRARQPPGKRDGQGAWQIDSPVVGRVLRVLQESEAVVGLGTPLMEIADAEDLEIVVDVLSSDALRITPRALVRIDAGGGYSLEGRVRRVEPAAFTKVSALGVEEQRVNVLIDFTSPRAGWQSLGDAFRVDVRIVTLTRADAVQVPVSALFREAQQWSIFVVEQGKAHKRAVKVGARTPLAALVDEGLQPGESVIVYPGDRVAEGKRVEVTNQGRSAR